MVTGRCIGHRRPPRTHKDAMQQPIKVAARVPGLESHFQEFRFLKNVRLSSASCTAGCNLVEPSTTSCMLCMQTFHNVDVHKKGTDKQNERLDFRQEKRVSAPLQCYVQGVNYHNETSCVQEQQQARTGLLAACSSGLQRVRAGQTLPQNTVLTGWAANCMGQGMANRAARWRISARGRSEHLYALGHSEK